MLFVFTDLRQLMDTGLERPRVNTFEVVGCGWERIPCTPGYLTKGEPCSAKQGNSPTSRGRRRQKLDTFRGGGWTSLCSCSSGSGASSPHLRVLRFRSPFQVRLLRET